MAHTYYLTAGLPAIDYNDSPPSGDHVYLMTAGLVANDYTPAAGAIKLDRARPIGIYRGMFRRMWGNIQS